MRHAIDADRLNAGIGEDDLVGAGGGRVAFESGAHVGHEQRAQRRQRVEKLVGDGGRARFAGIAVGAALEAAMMQPAIELLRQPHADLSQPRFDLRLERGAGRAE